MDAFAPDFGFDQVPDPFQKLLVLLAARFDDARDLFPCRRIDVPEGQIFQFAADLPHSQAVRDGSIDLDGFTGNPFPAIRLLDELECPHVVQTVRQLHDDYADIVHHSQQHFAETFRLPLLGLEEVQLAQLGDAVHAARHLLAEVLAYILDGDAGIFDHVVE